MLSHFSALAFANVSTDSELTLQDDTSRCDKECEVMNYDQLVFEGRDCCMNISDGDFVTLRTYLDGVILVYGNRNK